MRLPQVPETLRKHPVPIALAVGGGAFLLYRAKHGASALPFNVPGSNPAGTGAGQDLSGIGDAGAAPTPVDPGYLTSLQTIEDQLNQLAGLLPGQGQPAQVSSLPGWSGLGYSADAMTQAYGYTAGQSPQIDSPTGQLLGASISTVPAACSFKPLNQNCQPQRCKGVFGCIGSFLLAPVKCTYGLASSVVTCGGRIAQSAALGVATVGPSAGALFGPLGGVASAITSGIGTLGSTLNTAAAPRPAAVGYSPYAGMPYSPYGYAPTPPVYPYYTPPIAATPTPLPGIAPAPNRAPVSPTNPFMLVGGFA